MPRGGRLQQVDERRRDMERTRADLSSPGLVEPDADWLPGDTAGRQHAERAGPPASRHLLAGRGGIAIGPRLHVGLRGRRRIALADVCGWAASAGWPDRLRRA